MRWLRLAGDAIVAALVFLLAAPLWLLPWRMAIALGRGYGRVGFFLYPAGRRAGQINLRRAYGRSLSRNDARRRTIEVFGSLGQALAEGIQFARRFHGNRNDWQKLFDVEDPELHRRVLSDTHGRILVTAHLGSWEMTLMAAGRQSVRGGALMRRVDNPFVERLLRWARQPQGPLLDKQGGAAAAAMYLERGGDIALLLDENAGYRGVWVNFFGRAAATHRTAALLSARTSKPIVVAATVRRPGGRYLYRLERIEPVMSSDAVATATQEITSVLERWVRDDPSQWRWIHWRWKTRADGTQESYTRADLAACFAEPAELGDPATEENR